MIVGDTPLGSDGAFLLQFQERGVEGTVVEREEVAAGLLDAARNAITVQGSKAFQCFQDHQGEGALPDVCFVAHGFLLLTHRS